MVLVVMEVNIKYSTNTIENNLLSHFKTMNRKQQGTSGPKSFDKDQLQKLSVTCIRMTGLFSALKRALPALLLYTDKTTAF